MASVTHLPHAPHQGTLVELGQEVAHLEIVSDPERGHVDCYVLDHEAEEPIRLKQTTLRLHVTRPRDVTVDLRAVADPLTGETVGDTAHFAADNPALRGISAFDAVIVRVDLLGMSMEQVRFNFPRGNDSQE